MNIFQKLKLLAQLNELSNEIKKGQTMKWIPTLVTILLGLVGASYDPIQHYVTAHPLAAVIFAAVYAVVKGLASSPLGSNVPKAAAPIAVLVCFMALGSGQAKAQAVPEAPLPQNVYAGGISYNNGASPSIAGTALYARLLSDGSGTYAFTVVDALPVSVKPFTVNTNIGLGVAQKIVTIGKATVFVPTSAGISFNGTNTGWAWSTGALVSVPVKNNWRVFPNVRIVKSSVSGGTGYQPIVGVLVGWGQ